MAEFAKALDLTPQRAIKLRPVVGSNPGRVGILTKNSETARDEDSRSKCGPSRVAEPVMAPDKVSSKTCNASDWHVGE